MPLTAALLVLLQAAGGTPAPEPLAPPADADVRRAEEEIREAFKEEFSLRSPDDRKALGEKLYNVGRQSREAPATQYALLTLAAEAAAKAGDALTASLALDELAGRFTVDLLALKSEALKEASRYAKTPEAAGAVVDASLAAVDQAVGKDDFAAARTFLSRAETAARRTRDASLVAAVKSKKDSVKAVETAYRPVKAAVKKLEENPADPEANFTVGRYICLMKDDWRTGLFLLSQGSDRDYRALAEKEAGAPKEDGARIALGDAWWDVAEKERSKDLKRRIQGRAVHWYEPSVAAASGLDKLRIEQRIESYYSVGGVTRITCDEGKSMKPFANGYRQMTFPVQETEDPTGPFRKQPVYFQQKTGEEVHYNIMVPYPVRQIYWKGAAMQRLIIEVRDLQGNVLATGGPYAGGNRWGEFTVDMPPRTRFVLVIKNYISTWLFIDTIELRR